REALTLQPLGVEADVPGGEPAAGERLELGELLERRRAGRGGELAQEIEHLAYAVRHAGRERVLGVVGEVEQPRRLVPALEDLLDHARVVPAGGAGAPVRGARHPRLVEIAPQVLRL